MDVNEQQNFENVLGALGARISGVTDPRIIEEVRTRALPLADLCDIIGILEPEIKSVREDIGAFFSERKKQIRFSPREIDAAIRDHAGVQFFTNLYEVCEDVLSKSLKGHTTLKSTYDAMVGAKLDEIDEKKAPFTAITGVPGAIERLAQIAAENFVNLKIELPQLLEFAHKYAAQHNKYLKERFVKHDEPEKKEDRLLQIIRDQEERVKYVKIKLIDDNPILTDVLLTFAEHLPQYHERTIKQEKKRLKKVREVSHFAIAEAGAQMLKISDPKLYDYLQNPKTFFTKLGRIIEDFYKVFKLTEQGYQKVCLNPQFKIMFSDEKAQECIEEPLDQTVERNIRKIKHVDFESVVQNQDDIMPENRIEKDYFKLRDKLLTHIHQAIKSFAEEFKTKPRDKKDYEAYEKDLHRAEKIIEDAVEINAEINDVLVSHSARRLRKDKQSDNEYYEGMQGDIRSGDLFYFERKPTPNVKLDDVVGASFETAKNHLKQTIETAEYPHVMRLSAPDGKVRSNIFLIGPYGCGKTQLAKAVCGDKRVIGASVSVASTLTAWMHESVNNIKRIYDAAKQLYIAGREQKPVVLVLDEFDSWFASGMGPHADTDMQQIKNVLQEILDGMGDYHGIITFAMTNEPLKIPPAILRRFRYVDIVGQLNEEERGRILKNYLEKSLPISDDVSQHYPRWAQRLDGAVGDVIRKIVDEIHAEVLPTFTKEHPREARMLQRALSKRELNRGVSDDKDILYLKEKLKNYQTVSVADVDRHLETILKKPQIQLQINKAKKLYDDAQRLLDELSSGEQHHGFGIHGSKSELFNVRDD